AVPTPMEDVAVAVGPVPRLPVAFDVVEKCLIDVPAQTPPTANVVVQLASHQECAAGDVAVPVRLRPTGHPADGYVKLGEVDELRPFCHQRRTRIVHGTHEIAHMFGCVPIVVVHLGDEVTGGSGESLAQCVT